MKKITNEIRKYTEYLFERELINLYIVAVNNFLSYAEYEPHKAVHDTSKSLSGLKKLKYDKGHELVMYENTRADSRVGLLLGSECFLNALAIDEPLEYACLYLEGNMQMWGDAEDGLELW